MFYKESDSTTTTTTKKKIIIHTHVHNNKFVLIWNARKWNCHFSLEEVCFTSSRVPGWAGQLLPHCESGPQEVNGRVGTPAVIKSSEMWNLKWKPLGFSTDCWSTGCHWSRSVLGAQWTTSMQKTKQRREDGRGSREEISGMVRLGCLLNAFQMHPAVPCWYHLDFDTIQTPSVPPPGVGWETAAAVKWNKGAATRAAPLHQRDLDFFFLLHLTLGLLFGRRRWRCSTHLYIKKNFF